MRKQTKSKCNQGLTLPRLVDERCVIEYHGFVSHRISPEQYPQLFHVERTRERLIGTVARDCQPLIFFNYQPRLDP
jgi:hypothetical protein